MNIINKLTDGLSVQDVDNYINLLNERDELSELLSNLRVKINTLSGIFDGYVYKYQDQYINIKKLSTSDLLKVFIWESKISGHISQFEKVIMKEYRSRNDALPHTAMLKEIDKLRKSTNTFTLDIK